MLICNMQTEEQALTWPDIFEHVSQRSRTLRISNVARKNTTNIYNYNVTHSVSLSLHLLKTTTLIQYQATLFETECTARKYLQIY